jgi:hypothetical protein
MKVKELLRTEALRWSITMRYKEAWEMNWCRLI